MLFLVIVSIAGHANATCGYLEVGCERNAASSWSLGAAIEYAPRDALIAPYAGVGESIDENAWRLGEVARQAPLEAGVQWAVRVSGGMLPDARGAGSSDWDYTVGLRLSGEFPSDGEIDPGNYNYMVTGRTVIDRNLQELGISDPQLRDSISYGALIAASAAYQWKSDMVGENRHVRDAFASVSPWKWGYMPGSAVADFVSALGDGRTWYGEDEDDLRSLDMGFEHSRWLDLQELGRRNGVAFDLRLMGQREADPGPYRLLDESQDLLRQFRDFETMITEPYDAPDADPWTEADRKGPLP